MIEKPAVGDEDEFIDLLEVTIEEAEEMVAMRKYSMRKQHLQFFMQKSSTKMT